MTQNDNARQDERLPLKIGVILPESGQLSNWQLSCIEKLSSLKHVHIDIMFNLNMLPPSKTYRLRNTFRYCRHMLFHLYHSRIQRSFMIGSENVSAFLQNIPLKEITAYTKDNISKPYCLSNDGMRQVKEYQLDIILSLKSSLPSGELNSLARYGIWYFRFSDDNKLPPFPHCFWEVYRNDSITVASLCKLSSDTDGVILKNGYFRTVLFSYRRNLAQCYRTCSFWPTQACNDIINNVHIKQPVSIPSCISQSETIPCNMQMIVYIFKMFSNILAKALGVLFRHEQWNIGICYEPISKFLDPDFKPEIQWSPFISKKSYLADPFGLEENGTVTILCEEYSYQTGKGFITALTGDRKVFCALPQAVIQMPFHMSYPYMIKHRGEIYCLPEMMNNREIALYKAIQFPYKWEKVNSLLTDVAGVDPVIIKYGGLWWLFFTDNDRGDCLNLFLYYSDDLFGPWKPHINNPVKTDIRSTRPAGTPFISNGILYRPTQDCSSTYGGQVVINKIVKLSPVEFREEFEIHIEPDKTNAFNYGFHTLSQAGEFTLVDGKRWIFSIHEFRLYMKKILTGNL